VGADGNAVGIEYQTVLGYPPADFVYLAAQLGCGQISMKPSTGNHTPYDPYQFGRFSFVEDLDLRRRMASALADTGVSISLAEGFVVTPGVDLTADPTDLDLMWELGARRANIVTVDPDLARSFDQFAAFADQAAERGMTTTLEFSPALPVGDLATALAAVRHVDRPDFGLLIDTMHVVRSGANAADLAALDPAVLGYIQLCDHTLRQRAERYRDESSDRMIPGEGELPLVDVLAALPAALPIGVEVPMRAAAAQGIPVADYTRRAVDGARRVVGAARARQASQA
jgi:sugar phosphate isomerase/epimerase